MISGQAALGDGPNGNHGNLGANLGDIVNGTKGHPQQPAGARLGRDSLRCYQQMFCLRKAMPMRILGC